MASWHVYEIIYTRRFKKDFLKAPRHIQLAVDEALEKIRRLPARAPGVKPLKGQLRGLYRYRIGDYRLIYGIDEAKVLVIAVGLGARGDVYK